NFGQRYSPLRGDRPSPGPAGRCLGSVAHLHGGAPRRHDAVRLLRPASGVRGALSRAGGGDKAMKRFGITDPKIEDYLEAHLPPRDPVLLDMEAHAERENVPIIGPVEGQFLYTLALSVGAREMLDVGTAI